MNYTQSNFTHVWIKPTTSFFRGFCFYTVHFCLWYFQTDIAMKLHITCQLASCLKAMIYQQRVVPNFGGYLVQYTYFSCLLFKCFYGIYQLSLWAIEKIYWENSEMDILEPQKRMYLPWCLPSWKVSKVVIILEFISDNFSSV